MITLQLYTYTLLYTKMSLLYEWSEPSAIFPREFVRVIFRLTLPTVMSNGGSQFKSFNNVIALGNMVTK